MSERLEQARTEAERRFAIPADDEHVLVDTNQVEAFASGAQWADTNPQPTAITEAEFEDAYTYWFDGLPSRERAFEFLWALGVKVLDTDTEA